MFMCKTLARVILCLLGGIFFSISATYAGIKDEPVFLATRPGVIQPFLITSDSEIPPQGIAILFPGSAGDIGIRLDRPVTNGNFLVRSRQIFVRHNIVTAVMDAPSDYSRGMDTAFRVSKEHASDIASVIDEMKLRFPGIPVYLVGTSRGTISAGYAAETLQSKIDGVVLTSTVFQGMNFPLKGLTVPVLLVHNTDDGCPVSPYSGAKAAAKTYGCTLISVHGGSAAAGKAACGPFSPHGYLNKEEVTITAIGNWMFHRGFEKDI